MADFFTSMIAGACAGVSVDVALFPIDTIKTRLQAPQGFRAAGGFKGIWNGVEAAAFGSAPGAAMFFTVYESMKPLVKAQLGEDANPAYSHMGAASCGEVAACLIRVPTEVVKLQMQTGVAGCETFGKAVSHVYKSGGVFGGLYRGFGVTIMREIPFALIQFPIYERVKVEWGAWKGEAVSPVEAALCGSMGGAVGAALTTPLDVIKTRLMLGADSSGKAYKSFFDTLSRVVRDEGAITLLSGVQPRVMWISIGGFVFFGAYETATSVIGSL
jgi:solute carrier family 25 S-adenosylmethionine transporter 26